MYSFFKKIVRLLLPDKVLYVLQEPLRWPVYLYYYGPNYHCPICKASLRQFINPDQEGYRLCPKCGSLDRHRRLWAYLQNEKLLKGTCLDFSPSPFLKKRFQNDKQIKYITTDYVGAFVADYKYDINHIECKDEEYDTIICYHVLEHIHTDVLAMSELYRVLKQMGVAIIQTPFSDRLLEDVSINTAELRLKHYGQEDHVRVYDVQTLTERLRSVGFEVRVLKFEDPKDNRYGFKSIEYIIIAQKC